MVKQEILLSRTEKLQISMELKEKMLERIMGDFKRVEKTGMA
jgi:hypothetical protein